MSYVLAIDVGTSYTAAALIRPSGSPSPIPEILPLGLHGSAVPSVLFYAADGRILVGEAAERRGLDDPGRMVREFKRRIGDSVPLAVGEAWLAPEDVYATMARWVVDRAEEREGSSPSSIIMTHPASWGGHRTSTVLAALNLAGLADVTLISEPVAAALHYAAQTRVEDGSTVAVYDLGGGTFDTAVLRKTAPGTFELLGRPDGIETLGGADFDAAVLRHVIAHLGGAIEGVDPESPEIKASLSRLRRECREAKEALSMDSEASVAVALPGTQRTLRLVRSEFEALIEAPIRETVHALERSLRSINVEPAELSAVLLIGGSSRIPLVAGMISVELDRPIAVDADPKSSICLGAAVAGAGISAAMDAAAVAARASAVPEAAASSGPGAVSRAHVVARPQLGAKKFSAARFADKPGHAPRARLRLAAAAVTAATALTIATATAAQSPEGNGILASMFGSQAADVMRGEATPLGPPHAGSGGAPGAAPAAGGSTAGLEASVGAGVTRTGTGKSPARSGKAAIGGPGTGAGTGQGSTAGSPASVGGAAGTGGTSGALGTGSSAGTNGAPVPGTPGTTTPLPEPTGGAASGPTPPPATTPPATTPPTVPPPVTDPTTPPVVSDPSVPPPSTEPPAPQPEPTAPQNPVPPSPEPTVPQQEPTQPAADPAPIPSETNPIPDPALTPAV
ncbi:Hsp70 family protein [Paenarthrobacter sp. NPDC057981]|uniref:Hsp70 family protein n=1 Tax=Paenarthrobacter sp. NPDC057981 TaxID=3346297 RepID=UPI0036DDAE70